MVTAILTTMALAMTLIASKSSYGFLRFFAGACWWLLGVWLIYTPLVVGSSPVNDIVLTLCFLGGFGVMMMLGWTTNQDGGGSFNIRMPRFLGGLSEGEELEQRSMASFKTRQERHRKRLNNATRGRR